MKKNDRDIARKRYFNSKERLADLTNMLLLLKQEMCGENESKARLLKPEDFIEISPELYTTEIMQGGKYSRKRTVDAANLITIGGGRCCFLLEHQELTDYRMPERILSGESIWYHETADCLKQKRRMAKDWKSSEEWVGGLSEKDRLIPVFTLVIYYGSGYWKGAKNLHRILEMDALPEAVQKLINNYEIHILEVGSFEHLEWFETDLKETFGFIKYAGEEEKLREFVTRHRKVFENLPEDAYDFITFQTGTRKLERFKKEYQKRERGRYDMCKAIDDMERHAEERGKKLGEAQGRRQGEAKMEKLMQRLFEEKRFEDAQKVLSNRAYRGRLYRKYDIK